MRKIIVACGVVILTGCGITQQLSGLPGGSKPTPGQLFCALETQAGPLVVTILDAAGVPFVVTGLAQTAVATACKAWNTAAVPVAPAAGPVPSVAVPVVAQPALKG